MKDQVLSIEQMQKLKELGVDDSKAKIYWCKKVDFSKLNGVTSSCTYLSLNRNNVYDSLITFEYTPTFTLQDMIELMPSNINSGNEDYYLDIDKNCIQYINIEESPIYWSNENDILINAFYVLVWLAKNKYI